MKLPPSRFAGCGAKLGPGLLDKALCNLSQPAYPGLIADFRHSEDAGVLQLDGEKALIHTVDFFPPIVEDPFTFGRIAAANALSDIYAMGGRPITAVCMVGFPVETLELEALRRMMEGGLQCLREAECPLVGGHSIQDAELKLGYSVTGLVHPRKVWLNNTLRGSERLILTKPIGTGLVTTAARAGLASPRALEAAVASMCALNRRAAEVLARHRVSACTDVTGFGLMGHACEMVADTAWNVRLETASVPVLPSAREYASMGLVPEGTYRNKEFRLRFVSGTEGIDPDLLNVLFDPQTSGGLLAAVPAETADAALRDLAAEGIAAAMVGETVKGGGLLELR
jgi:selenide, water dikinase